MKKFFTVSLAVAGALLLVSGSAFAFHGGGVGHCDGCHTMHNSPTDNGAPPGTPGPSLQKGSDNSSTCLNCHNGADRYHVNSADGSNTNEGGDFHWVNDNGYAFQVRPGVFKTVDYNNLGHSVVAADFGMSADENLTTAPGGSFLAAELGCSSCHDPHGQAQGGTIGGAAPISVSGSYGEVPPEGTIAGNYRLLYDSNKVGFSEDAPIARASGYDGKSTQYGSGMSGWCANCHGQFYSQSASGGMHPTDVSVPTVYNSYVATGNFTGDISSAYDPLVPIERGVTTGSWDLPSPGYDSETGQALEAAATAGVDGSSQVMCLSCHRAHASAFDNALRWDYTTSEFIAESWMYKPQTGTPVAETAAPYYKHGEAIDVADPGSGNPFTDGYGEYQRSLCNKCHVQD
ncbi:hypothetical protein [Geoalkalibacter subterraneus]|uniref:Uncharacterized protein n=1 Tax=Geoalkalibacter subterraneus TaxID=483547 RepID=A0A0B5FGE2_9BACT|nr:hypothetical protein [Geoalkalibacter subterraneus]AJF06388.1 hypothetical protein GSUB_07275 [Geoalkalibacter subterraneus]